MPHLFSARLWLTILCFFACTAASAQTTFFGPTPYVQQSDTPAAFIVPGLKLENFEDNVLDPMLSMNTAIIGPGGQTDSVDADDGLIDGSGTNGRSVFGVNGVRISFASLQIAAGIVWTDGGSATSVSFEAFGPTGASIGVYGPFVLGDNFNTGQTAEDRFFGVHHAQGISAIFLTHTSGGYEADHIQWASDTIFKDGFE